MVLVAAIVLGSSTYAWFVSNNTVTAKTASISAQLNAPFLMIDKSTVTTTSGTSIEFTEANTALYPAQVVADGTNPKFQSAYASKKTEATELANSRYDVGDAAAAVTAGFAIKETFYIGTADDKAGSFKDLKVSKVELSTDTGKLDNAVSVLLVCGTNWAVYKVSADGTILDKYGDGTTAAGNNGAGILAATIAATCLTSATYAWYVTNNTVKATTSSISAKTNGFILQIATLEEGAQHGGEQSSLEAMTTGATLSPASTDNLEDWYVCQSWDNQGFVTDYSVPSFGTGTGAIPGNYKVAGKDYYAFIKSDYIVYTITSTGTADVYLEDDGTEPPIVVTAKNGSGSTTVTDSLRVAITTQEIDASGNPVGTETLKVVYATKDETGKGNDKSGINGWTGIQKSGSTGVLAESTYTHIYGTPHTAGAPYNDQNGKNWVAKRDGENYSVESGTMPIATNVGYDGIIVHVYIWMEGTDADCVNGKSIEDDPSTYDVTVKLAGVATGN